MNKLLDPAYTAALRRKPFIPPEIYAYPAQARRGAELTLPPAPVLIEAVDEPGLDLGDVLCIAVAVGLWVFVAVSGVGA
jgi:hypothetical protein